MRILWITNMLLPDIASFIDGNNTVRRSGTWLDNWLSLLRDENDIELSVACISGSKFLEKKINNVTYYVIPGNGRTMLIYHPNLVKYWDIIEQKFHPEIIHIHGTEYTHSISYIRKYPGKKYVLSIQGLLSPIVREYYGGISNFSTYRYRTIKEWLKQSGTVGVRMIYKHNIRYENEIIKNSTLAIGRYDFDEFYIKSINNSIRYKRCNYSLREEFYSSQKWSVEGSKPHTIFAGASITTPIKGGHVLLNAIRIVKKKYPDVKVIFVGVGDTNGDIVDKGGYKRYIKKLIKSYGLVENCVFYPVLSTKDMIDLMLSSYCIVVPSAMDNGSTILREAMHLGLPSIASYRGGLTGLLKDGESGFYYDYPEYTFLAGRIMQLFDNQELANELSQKAICYASQIHDKKKNSEDLLRIYQQLLSDN